MKPWTVKVDKGRKCRMFPKEPLERHGECAGEGEDVLSPEIGASRGRSV